MTYKTTDKLRENSSNVAGPRKTWSKPQLQQADMKSVTHGGINPMSNDPQSAGMMS